MRQISAVMIGAGDRGTNAFGPYAINNPGTIRFIAVVEKDNARRDNFCRMHNISESMAFDKWDDMFSLGKIADAVFICTNEKFHYEPVKLAMSQGYHILLEKPITQDPYTCVEIGDLAANYDKVFMLGYVLRYTPFFAEIKKRIREGAIGKVKTILLSENTGMAHFSHSYVRGTFGREDIAGPMILSKCCHDMDILNWITDSRCVSLSSYATDTYFREENAPQGAPKRCTDGCPVSDECYFYAPKMYSAPRSGFNVEMISVDQSSEGRMRALEEGPFGRCVYYCDNDVVDTQVINMLFESGVTASFSMTAYSEECYRMIKISGTAGEIEGTLESNEFEIIDFASGRHERVNVSTVLDRHSGGDYFIMTDFIKHVRSNKKGGRTDAAQAVDSHVMCFAAEKSRKDGNEIDLGKYKQCLRSGQSKE